MKYTEKLQNIEHCFVTKIKFYEANVVFVFEIFEFWEGKWNIEEKLQYKDTKNNGIFLLLRNLYTVYRYLIIFKKVNQNTINITKKISQSYNMSFLL